MRNQLEGGGLYLKDKGRLWVGALAVLEDFARRWKAKYRCAVKNWFDNREALSAIIESQVEISI